MKKRLKKKFERKESVATATMTALLRGGARRESDTVLAGSIQEADSGALIEGEGTRFKVVLISEGLGNRRQMNYYGPEAIASAPAAFEGKPCFLDHPSESEGRDLPERSVDRKCGYYKNVVVGRMLDGRMAAFAELHTDLSESGKCAADKMLTALHYRKEFPGSDLEYVGLSVNADGETERRVVAWEGERLEANYVTAFTNGESVDLVTKPARGGKILALLESARGAIAVKEEVRAMIIKTLESALKDLKEAESAVKDDAAKKPLTKSREALEGLLTKAVAAAKEAEARIKAGEGEGEGEGEEDPVATAAAKHEAKMGKLNAMAAEMGYEVRPKEAAAADDDGAAAEAEDDDGDGDEPTAGGDKYPNKTMGESHRIAVESLCKEAGLGKDEIDWTRANKSLKEAKAEISRAKAMKESIEKGLLAKLGDQLPVFNIGKMTEATGGKVDEIFASRCRR